MDYVALILAFTLGLGMSVIDGNRLKSVMDDFKDIINQVITAVIIPVLPLYIFGIFPEYDQFGQVAGVMNVFLKDYCRYFCDDRSLVVYSVFVVWSVKNPLRLF